MVCNGGSGDSENESGVGISTGIGGQGNKRHGWWRGKYAAMPCHCSCKVPEPINTEAGSRLAEPGIVGCGGEARRRRGRLRYVELAGPEAGCARSACVKGVSVISFPSTSASLRGRLVCIKQSREACSCIPTSSKWVCGHVPSTGDKPRSFVLAVLKVRHVMVATLNSMWYSPQNGSCDMITWNSSLHVSSICRTSTTLEYRHWQSSRMLNGFIVTRPLIAIFLLCRRRGGGEQEEAQVPRETVHTGRSSCTTCTNAPRSAIAWTVVVSLPPLPPRLVGLSTWARLLKYRRLLVERFDYYFVQGR